MSYRKKGQIITLAPWLTVSFSNIQAGVVTNRLYTTYLFYSFFQSHIKLKWEIWHVWGHIHVQHKPLRHEYLSSAGVNKFTCFNRWLLSVLCILSCWSVDQVGLFKPTLENVCVQLFEKRFINHSKCYTGTQVFIKGAGCLCSLCQYCFFREKLGHYSERETDSE